jgi:hypothetical protein
MPEGDYVTYLAPNARFIQAELRAGRLPLWNPYVATGIPVVETGQTALFHPFTSLLFAVPFEHSLTWMAVLRLAIAGLGSFLLARVLGCRIVAAGAAGVLFMFSPFLLHVRLSPLANASMLLPWLLAVSELRVRGGSATRLGAAWALLGALMFLGGHQETTVHCLGVAVVYHLLRTASLAADGRRWRHLRSEALFLTVCGGLAALSGAVAVFGHLTILSESGAIPAREWLGYRGLNVRSLPSLLLPGSATFFGYVGIAALVFAARGAASKGRFPGTPWILLGTLALLGAYGVWPVRPILGALPLVGLAAHARLLFVTHLCLALLVARGLDAPDDRRARTASIAACAGLAACLVFLWVGSGPDGLTNVFGERLTLTQPILFLGAAGILIAVFWRRPAFPAWGWLVVALLLADIYVAHGPRPRGAPAAYPPAPRALEVLRASPGIGRAFIPARLMPANVGMVYGTASIAAYEPTLSRRTVTLLHHAGLRNFLELFMFAPDQPEPAALRILNLLNVDHIIARPPLEDSQLVGSLEPLAAGPVAVYRNPNAFPRAFVANRAIVAGDARHAVALLMDPEIDLRQTVILEERLAWDPYGIGDARAPRARIVEYLPGNVRIEAEAPRGGGLLVFSEKFSPSWRVTVDDETVEAVRGDYDLLVVPLLSGRHEVHFRYLPLSVFAGGIVSAVTMVVLLVGLLHRSRLDSPHGISRSSGDIS